MAAEKSQQELGEVSRELLLARDFRKAEYLLWEIVRTAPRAPTATYLLGIAILFQKRFLEARRIIDRAYALRLWVADRIVAPLSIEILREAARDQPDWDWARYQLARERWRSIGLTLETAVARLAERGSPPTFVQVGANDGKRGDPLFALVREKGMKGLLVEPQPESFAKLQQNYAGTAGLAFENVAVTEADGPVEMTTTSDRETIGSIVPDRNILKLRQRGELRTITVDGLTFASLTKKHAIDRFDVLQIDTEGFDYRVLRQVDLVARDVKIVNLEYYCLPVGERLAACEQLESAGFALSAGEMDLLAVRRALFEETFCITDLLAGLERPSLVDPKPAAG